MLLQLPMAASTAHLTNIHPNLIMHRPTGSQQQHVFENMTSNSDSQSVESGAPNLYSMRNACGFNSLDEMIEWSNFHPLQLRLDQNQQYHPIFPLQHSAPKSPLMHKNSSSNSSISIESSSNDSSGSVRESESPINKRARFQMSGEEAVVETASNSVLVNGMTEGDGINTGERNADAGLVLENAD
jgi:hypothetical protein